MIDQYALQKQLEEMQRQLAQSGQPTQIPAPTHNIDPLALEALVAKKVAEALPQKSADPAPPPASAATPSSPAGHWADMIPVHYKLGALAVIGENNLEWLLSRQPMDMLAFAVSKEGRETLGLLIEEMRQFSANLRPSA